ncbi:MAG TPA: hypothetical protein VL970_07215 [Candidatus Acidoferrales bacterium]|nr:hypothetical protein [Candidatus Acidoferrales bacterium]
MADAEERENFYRLPRYWFWWTAFTLAVVGLLTWLIQWCTWSITSREGEELWNFTSGVSVWLADYVRLLALVGAGIFFLIVSLRRERHRKRLWKEFFHEQDDREKRGQVFQKQCSKRWKCRLSRPAIRGILRRDAYNLWKLSGQTRAPANCLPQARIELKRERKSILLFGWMPTFIKLKNPSSSSAKVFVHAVALFKYYLRFGKGWRRMLRAAGCVGLYAFIVAIVFLALGEDWQRPLIRGHDSKAFDQWVLSLSGAAVLLVLYYLFDAAFLSKRLLDHISRHPTLWPAPVLLKRGVALGIAPGRIASVYLAGLLEVEFAAVQTNEVGLFLLAPFPLLFLLLLSHNAWLGNSSCPPLLFVVFAVNTFFVGFCWWMLRRAAGNVRDAALARLEEFDPSARPSRGDVAKIRERIKNEKRGAFATFFQDPTTLAASIPAGITGIISLVSSFL